ncbi:hypothetical protein [Aquimarina longa]|uniref:hypothetical protein n=1 Tax=Aquimarina longa TaxID=1080221 RepID=UPI000785A962|nr:hypothetical protein [Aquimarina longa]
MLTLAGILMILAEIIIFIIKPFIRISKILNWFIVRRNFHMIRYCIGLALSVISGIFFFIQNLVTAYAVQYPWY